MLFMLLCKIMFPGPVGALLIRNEFLRTELIRTEFLRTELIGTEFIRTEIIRTEFIRTEFIRTKFYHGLLPERQVMVLGPPRGAKKTRTDMSVRHKN